MSVALIDIRQNGLWSRTAQHCLSRLFSSPPWIEALAHTYDLRFSASAQVENGNVVAAIPFCYVKDIRGERVISLPFCDYCDPLLEGTAEWEDLVKPILDLDVPVALRCRSNPTAGRDDRFAIVEPALWHAVDLTRSEGELWTGLSDMARRNIRKAERSGLVVREGKSFDDLRLFYQMHCQVRKSKYRLLAQPMAFFENLYEAFAPSDGIAVLLAEVDNSPIAAILLLKWKDVLYYKLNASVDLGCRPNDLLIWRSMLLGQSLDMKSLDFGISDVNQPGLVSFKRKFATEERKVQMLRWRPPGYSDPRGEEVTALLNRVTQLLTDPAVPDEITRMAGDDLYRFFC